MHLVVRFAHATDYSNGMTGTESADGSFAAFLKRRRSQNPDRRKAIETAARKDELHRYLNCDIEESVDESTWEAWDLNPLTFWKQKQKIYPKLAHMALQVLSIPASQASSERTFSTCGFLTNTKTKRQPDEASHGSGIC